MWFSPSSVSAGALAISLLLSQATALKVEGGSDKLSSYLAAHPVATKSAAAAPASISANALAPELVNLVLSHCPAGCGESGSSPGNWTLYPRLGRLSMCNQTMLLDFSLFTSLRKDETIRACTASSAVTLSASSVGNTTNDASCLPSGSLTKAQESLQLAFNKTSTPATLEDFDAASRQLAAALSQRDDSNCTDTTSFAYSNSVALGLFAGPLRRASSPDRESTASRHPCCSSSSRRSRAPDSQTVSLCSCVPRAAGARNTALALPRAEIAM